MPYIGKAPKNSVRSRFTYQATAGQTSFSGSDSNALTLSYVDSLYMDVYQNGVLLKAGTDYTATTGTTVVLVSSASADDVVEMVVYDVFDVADTYSKSDADSRFVNVTGDGMTGNFGIGTTSPSRELHVQKASSGATPTTGSVAVFEDDDNTEISLLGGSSSILAINLGDSSDPDQGGIRYNTTSGSREMQLYVEGGARVNIDGDGHVTMPNQSAFLVNPSSNQTDIAVNGFTTIAFGTERFDQNGDFASNTFTAPVTGRYQFNLFSYITGFNHGYSLFQMALTTSNVDMRWTLDGRYGDANPDYLPITFSSLVDMDANDTAYIRVYIPNYGSAQLDFDAASFFSGYLVC